MWAAILIFVVGYKLGEAMAGVMATPLYVALGFSLDEIAAVSQMLGFFPTVAGDLVGGLVTARLGVRAPLQAGCCSRRAIVLCVQALAPSPGYRQCA